MHKRNNIKSTTEGPYNQAVSTNAAVKHGSFGPDDKKTNNPELMCSSGKAAVSSIWRDILVLAGVACLFFISALVVSNDRVEYYSSNGIHGQSNIRARDAHSLSNFNLKSAKKTRFVGSQQKQASLVSPSMSPPHVGIAESAHRKRSDENIFSTTSEEHEEGSNGGEHQTMGKSVLDALQSQKQTNSAITTDRMIIREGDMHGTVPGSKLDSTAEQISSLVEDPTYGEGGYVERHYSRENEYYIYISGQSKQMIQRTIDLNLRIPSRYFPAVAQKIKDIVEDATPEKDENPNHKGKVTSISTNGRDVTDEFVDTTARADTIDASRKAIQVLLSRADTINDVMKIQGELNSLTQSSESLRRRALELKNKSELSTLNVQLVEYREDDNNDDWDNAEEPSWTPLKSAKLALTHISVLAMYVFDIWAYSMVWAVPITCFYVVGVFIVKIFFSK